MALFKVAAMLTTAVVVCFAHPQWKLKAVKDTTLESGADLGSSQYILVGKHSGFPKKRFVVQFEDIPSNCSEVIRAVMYLKYAYAHKDPKSQAPLVTRNLCVHQVLREWDEGTIGGKTYLSENTDYNSQCVDIVTMTPDSIEGQLTNGFVPFDITELANAWLNGDANYGILVRDMNEDVLGHDRRFHSSESPTEDFRPYVDVTCFDGSISGVVTPDADLDAIKTLEGITGLALKVFERILDKMDGSTNRVRDEEYPRDCTEVLASGYTLSGVYVIKPDNLEPFSVFCDQETDGGGWTVFQRRQDGSVSFNQNWREFENGFGDLRGEFWLGLSKIHRLTHWKLIPFELRVGVEDFEDNSRYVEYSRFYLDGPSKRYTLHIAGYSSSSTLGQDINGLNGRKFTARDRDNDLLPNGNCAATSGGWWFHACFNVQLNGVYQTTNPVPRWHGLIWHAWKGAEYSLRYSEMKTRPNIFKQSSK